MNNTLSLTVITLIAGIMVVGAVAPTVSAMGGPIPVYQISFTTGPSCGDGDECPITHVILSLDIGRDGCDFSDPQITVPIAQIDRFNVVGIGCLQG